MGGVLIAPLFSVLAVQQYRGTFRGVPSAATTASVIQYGWGGLLLFGVATTAGEAMADSIAVSFLASVLVPMFLSASFSLVSGRMNALWARCLRTAFCAGAARPIQRGFSLRELILAVTVIAAMTAITTPLIRTAKPKFAEHIHAADAPFHSPAGATDVSYSRGFRGTVAFEFTCDELAFRDWVVAGIGSIEARAAAVPIREISSSHTITRYYAYASQLNGPTEIAVNSGLFYSWSREDRGVHAVYDRATGRGYYHAHYH